MTLAISAVYEEAEFLHGLLHRLCPSFRKPSIGDTEPLPGAETAAFTLAWHALLC